jgi:hypothetical protein
MILERTLEWSSNLRRTVGKPADVIRVTVKTDDHMIEYVAESTSNRALNRALRENGYGDLIEKRADQVKIKVG